jgi:hypothetical protein
MGRPSPRGRRPSARRRWRCTSSVAARYIDKLEAKGVIQRQDGGFSLDQNRVAYLRYLRRERRRSPRSEADADHVRAKAELLRITIAEKQRVLVNGTTSMRWSMKSAAWC